MRAMSVSKGTTITSVFVYGTLKQGRPLDRPALAALRTQVQPATIQGGIFSLGAYPTIQLSVELNRTIDRNGVVYFEEPCLRGAQQQRVWTQMLV